MKTKLVALLLLVVLACSLASCSFVDTIKDKIGLGKDPEVTTTAATTTGGLTDPVRTEPAKVTTAPTQPGTPADPWGDQLIK